MSIENIPLLNPEILKENFSGLGEEILNDLFEQAKQLIQEKRDDLKDMTEDEIRAVVNRLFFETITLPPAPPADAPMSVVNSYAALLRAKDEAFAKASDEEFARNVRIKNLYESLSGFVTTFAIGTFSKFLTGALG